MSEKERESERETVSVCERERGLETWIIIFNVSRHVEKNKQDSAYGREVAAKSVCACVCVCASVCVCACVRECV